MSTQAATFAKLHQGPDLLVLPNAWDAGSARVIEHAGAKDLTTLIAREKQAGMGCQLRCFRLAR